MLNLTLPRDYSPVQSFIDPRPGGVAVNRKVHERGVHPGSPSSVDLVNSAFHVCAEAGAWTSCCQMMQTTPQATNLTDATFEKSFKKTKGRIRILTFFIPSHSWTFHITLDRPPFLKPRAPTIIYFFINEVVESCLRLVLADSAGRNELRLAAAAELYHCPWLVPLPGCPTCKLKKELEPASL